MKKVIAVISAIAVIVIAGVAFVFWPNSNITRDEARDIAIQHAGGGQANMPERTFEQFQRTWSVEVLVGEGIVHNVYLNSDTGEIIYSEFED